MVTVITIASLLASGVSLTMNYRQYARLRSLNADLKYEISNRRCLCDYIDSWVLALQRGAKRIESRVFDLEKKQAKQHQADQGLNDLMTGLANAGIDLANKALEKQAGRDKANLFPRSGSYSCILPANFFKC